MKSIPKRSLTLSASKRSLVQQMLQDEGLLTPLTNTRTKINRRNSNCNVPLSFAQERLWFLEELIPATTVHNIHRGFRLKGLLNLAALEASFNAIIKRHEILRTTFTIDGQPTQIIAEAWQLTISVVDLSQLRSHSRETEELIKQELQQPFELEKLPLWRVKLIRHADDEHTLLLTIHHLICDGWSLEIFCKELSAFYQEFSTGKPTVLPDIPIQYGDFAVWQRQWLQGEVFESQMAYWRLQLDGDVQAVLLGDMPTQNYAGLRQKFAISASLTQSLKILSQSEGVTLFMTLLAAFKALLHGYNQQKDIVISSPIAGRNRIETKPLIGCFNNLLPMRTNVDGNPSFTELLGRVRQVTLGAYNHSDIPYQKLAALPNLASTSLARVMLVFQNTPSYPLELTGIDVSSVHYHSGTSNFDLSVFLEEQGTEIFGEIEYKTAIFNSDTITQIIDNFQKLLETIVNDPNTQLNNLSFDIPTQLNTQQPKITNPDLIYPHDELEIQLIKIWEKVLGKKRINTCENFFDLGGHSLLAVQLFAEIAKVIGQTLPLATLFAAPTIEQLADTIRKKGWSPSWTSLVPIQPCGDKQPFFCIHGAGGHVLNYYPLARYFTDRPFYGLQSQGLDGKHPIHTTIPEMATHYIQEMCTVQPHGPYFVGGFCMGGTIALEIAQQLQAQGEKVSKVALLFTSNFAKVRLDWLFPKQPKFTWEQLRSIYYNLSLLKNQDKLTFVAGRLKTGQHRLMSRIVGMKAMSSLSSLRYMQEKAAIAYEPQAYSGQVVLLRPHMLKGDEIPELSWTGLFADFEVKELSVYPGAMLIEPFVENLARELETCFTNSSKDI